MNKKVIKELIFDLPNKEEFFLVHKPFQEDVKSVNVCASVFDDNFIAISIKSKFQTILKDKQIIQLLKHIIKFEK